MYIFNVLKIPVNKICRLHYYSEFYINKSKEGG